MSRVCLAVVLAAMLLASFSATALGDQHRARCSYGHWQQKKPGCHMKKMTLPGGGVRYLWIFERDRKWMYVFNPYEPRRWTARYPTKYCADCDEPQIAAEMCPEGADPVGAEWKLPPAPGGPLEAQDIDGRMVPVNPPNPKDVPAGI